MPKALAVSARHKAIHRFSYVDPVTYTTPDTRRIDAKFTLMGIGDDLIGIIDSETVGKRVRVKNTSGGAWAAGTLLRPAGALTPRTTAVASNNPAAGTSVVINVAATFEVGQIVAITSNGATDYAVVTAISAGVSVTVDILFYSHTAPTVTAEAAYEAVAADADTNTSAEWVTTASVADAAYAWVYDCFEVTGFDTTAGAAEALVYLSATAGGWTTTAPTGADQFVQVVGVVKESHATTGKILFFPGNKRILKFGTSFYQAKSILATSVGSGAAVSGKVLVADGSGGADWTGDSYNDEMAQDAVGTILTDSATIDFTYSDATPSITAIVIDDSITDTKLRNSTALSVIGRSANSTGDPADIAAANDGEALIRIGTTLGFNNFSALTEIDVALDDVLPLADTSASNANKKISVNRLLGLPGICDGRLTLTTATPVTTSDATSTTVYFTPYNGNKISLYDGTRWKLYTFTEISLTVTPTSPLASELVDVGAGSPTTMSAISSTANLAVGDLLLVAALPLPVPTYIASITDAVSLVTTTDGAGIVNSTAQFYDSMYDVFVYDNAGTLTLEQLAWTSNTARATAITLQDGVWVKSGATTRRYLGTFKIISATQTCDTSARRFLWNCYHRVPRFLSVVDTTDNWTYATQAWRQARGQSASRVEYICGLAEDSVQARVIGACYFGSGASSSSGMGHNGVGIDSKTVNSAQQRWGYAVGTSVNVVFTLSAQYCGIPGLGYHAVNWIEYGGNNGTSDVTFFGDNGGALLQTGLQAEVMA